jgi:predicted hotdog family 3-hydroxylacyl-ACP dehydratase
MASSEKIIADENNITRYIPQRPPMVMIGKLISVDDGRIVTSLIVTEDNIFCEDGVLKEPGLIENMAQTAAAGEGYAALNEQREPAIGFIGGIRNLKIYSFPPAGSEIITEISILHEVFDARIVYGKIFLHEELISECELKIFTIKK